MTRSFWKRLLEDTLASPPIIWLAGVRRAGKTVLCQSLPNIDCFDCELPSARRKIDDPERFLGVLAGRRIVIDEIHGLPNPSKLLQIAADHFPEVCIVATGSFSLGASRTFKDTLTGRKKDLWLTPMNLRDLSDSRGAALDVRMLHGGLPPFFLDASASERPYPDWLDAFSAKDILELFSLERQASFLRFAELLFAQSGGVFEAPPFTVPCEVSRTTIARFLKLSKRRSSCTSSLLTLADDPRTQSQITGCTRSTRCSSACSAASHVCDRKTRGNPLGTSRSERVAREPSAERCDVLARQAGFRD